MFKKQKIQVREQKTMNDHKSVKLANLHLPTDLENQWISYLGMEELAILYLVSQTQAGIIVSFLGQASTLYVSPGSRSNHDIYTAKFSFNLIQYQCRRLKKIHFYMADFLVVRGLSSVVTLSKKLVNEIQSWLVRMIHQNSNTLETISGGAENWITARALFALGKCLEFQHFDCSILCKENTLVNEHAQNICAWKSILINCPKLLKMNIVDVPSKFVTCLDSETDYHFEDLQGITFQYMAKSLNDTWISNFINLRELHVFTNSLETLFQNIQPIVSSLEHLDIQFSGHRNGLETKWKNNISAIDLPRLIKLDLTDEETCSMNIDLFPKLNAPNLQRLTADGITADHFDLYPNLQQLQLFNYSDSNHVLDLKTIVRPFSKLVRFQKIGFVANEELIPELFTRVIFIDILVRRPNFDNLLFIIDQCKHLHRIHYRIDTEFDKKDEKYRAITKRAKSKTLHELKLYASCDELLDALDCPNLLSLYFYRDLNIVTNLGSFLNRHDQIQTLELDEANVEFGSCTFDRYPNLTRIHMTGIESISALDMINFLKSCLNLAYLFIKACDFYSIILTFLSSWTFSNLRQLDVSSIGEETKRMSFMVENIINQNPTLQAIVTDMTGIKVKTGKFKNCKIYYFDPDEENGSSFSPVLGEYLSLS